MGRNTATAFLRSFLQVINFWVMDFQSIALPLSYMRVSMTGFEPATSKLLLYH